MRLNHKPQVYYCDGYVPEDVSRMCCEDCDGVGHYFDNNCPTCHGFGVYYVDRETYRKLGMAREKQRTVQNLMTGDEALTCIRVMSAIERQICRAYFEGRDADARAMAYITGRLSYLQTGCTIGELGATL